MIITAAVIFSLIQQFCVISFSKPEKQSCIYLYEEKICMCFGSFIYAVYLFLVILILLFIIFSPHCIHMILPIPNLPDFIFDLSAILYK